MGTSQACFGFSLSFNVCLMISLFLLRYVFKYIWGCLWSKFSELPPKIRRHDANHLLRAFTGFASGCIIVPIFPIVMEDRLLPAREHGEWVAMGIWFYVMTDLWELGQRRKFDWQALLHHTFQSLIAMFGFEIVESWRDPGVVFLTTLGFLGRVGFFLWPLSHVAAPSKIRAGARISLGIQVLAMLATCTGVACYLAKYWKVLPLFWKIMYPTAPVVLQFLDADIRIRTYKLAKQDDSASPRTENIPNDTVVVMNEMHAVDMDAIVGTPQPVTPKTSFLSQVAVF
eukprot:TRINITY_DN3530_c0_g1_i1.p1 TRINITY_DN3530_c0_g1~~TRINITY_DN3530_c0_g1_i1.p1  ORF type:complete len:295 (-),score=31.11 TRINITY_DN3530_c0_g1_i1:110-964(-)